MKAWADFLFNTLGGATVCAFVVLFIVFGIQYLACKNFYRED